MTKASPATGVLPPLRSLSPDILQRIREGNRLPELLKNVRGAFGRAGLNASPSRAMSRISYLETAKSLRAGEPLNEVSREFLAGTCEVLGTVQPKKLAQSSVVGFERGKRGRDTWSRDRLLARLYDRLFVRKRGAGKQLNGQLGKAFHMTDGTVERAIDRGKHVDRKRKFWSRLIDERIDQIVGQAVAEVFLEHQRANRKPP